MGYSWQYVYDLEMICRYTGDYSQLVSLRRSAAALPARQAIWRCPHSPPSEPPTHPATRDQYGQQVRPGSGIFGGGQLIVKYLMPPIRPQAQDSQDDPILATHLTPLVAALVEKSRAPWR
jgi:hypothetical protein